MKRSVLPSIIVALAAAPVCAQTLVLEHANVVDVVNGTIQANRTITIRNGIIMGVSLLPANADDHAINLRGAFVIPGLWDMHTHLGSFDRNTLALYVALGVTGVREMGGDLEILRAWRDSIRAGRLLGPRIVLAGPIVERAQWRNAILQYARQTNDTALTNNMQQRIGVDSVASAVAAVDAIVASGADFVKIRNDPSPAATFALLRRARERGIPAAGHWPVNITPQQASDSGYASLEHGPLAAVNRELVPLFDQMTEAQRSLLFERFVKNRTAYTPTITSLRAFRLWPDSIVERVLSDSLGPTRYVSPKVVASWRNEFALKKIERPPMDWAAFNRSFLKVVRPMVDAGVTLLAGADVGSPIVVPAFSLHDELEAMVVEAGLTPLQALRTATINPALFLNSSDFGRVAPRQRADLVILEANPLLDIRNVHRIKAVVRNGRLYNRAQLDSLIALSTRH